MLKPSTITFKDANFLTTKHTSNLEVKDVKDAEGNKASYAELLYVNDTVAPTVKYTKFTFADKKFVITFSEP